MEMRAIAKALLYYAIPAALIVYGFARNPLALVVGLTWLGTSVLYEVT